MAEDLRPRLIDPSDVGGLPVFNDDILQAQNNNRNTSNEYFEFLRSGINNSTGQLSWGDSPTTTTTRDMGLIISGCVTDKTVPSPYPVSEGYVYIDGEVMKFPGGTVTDNQFIEMKKSTVTNVQRTFKDGNPKDATEEYTLDWQVGATDPFWSPSYTGVQVIVIAPFYTELQTIIGGQSFLTQSAGVNGLLINYNNPVFILGTLEAYTTGSVRSRVKELYTNEVSISVNVETTTFDDAVEEYLVATLAEWSPTDTIRGVAYIQGATAEGDLMSNIRVLTNGQIWLRKPYNNATWPTSNGGTTYSIDFTGTAFGLPSIDAAYSGYNTTFMTKS